VQFDLVSWLIGIPTGVGVNWLSIWLYQRYQRKKQDKGDYFTTTYSNDGIDFEGHVKSHISTEEIIKSLRESLLKAEDKSPPNPPLNNNAD
jgi:hypothetical protein